MTHTQGPWKSGAIDDYGGVVPIYTPLHEIIAYATDRFEGKENVANARLIAAAPDLLEALKVSSGWMDTMVKWHWAFPFINETKVIKDRKTIKQAIALVEGNDDN